MSTTFTPGPWQIGLAAPDDGMFEIEAPALGPRNLGGDPRRPFVMDGCANFADARLVAAAPDLYAALSLAAETMRVAGMYEPAQRCEAAMSKARGEKTWLEQMEAVATRADAQIVDIRAARRAKEKP